MAWPHEHLETALERDETFAEFRWQGRRGLALHPADAERIVELVVRSRQRDPDTAQEIRDLRKHMATLEEIGKRLVLALVRTGNLDAMREAFSGMDLTSVPWLGVLKQPRATLGEEAPPGAEEEFRSLNAAVRAARATHPGQWVALRDGAVIDGDASRVALHRRLEAKGLIGTGLSFARIPPW